MQQRTAVDAPPRETSAPPTRRTARGATPPSAARSTTAPSHRPVRRAVTFGPVLVVTAVLAALAGAALARQAHVLLSPQTASSQEAVTRLVAGVVAGIGALAASWLAGSCVVGAGCVLARGAGRAWHLGERAVQRWAPAVVRRTVAGVVGAGLGLGLTVTGASAAELPAAPPRSPDAVVVLSEPGLGGPPLGWVVSTPDEDAGYGSGSDDATTPTPAPSPSSTTRPAAPQPAPRPAWQTPTATDTAPTDDTSQVPAPSVRATVVVEAGDSLWTIVAAQLAPGADDADIATEWPRWYDANRAVIGTDPDLLLPGQVLQAPEVVR
ncbi:LysM peptidoglycan-binding domain-containing protein [Cellulomonas composti]|uniref:LysM domain-containing protein n=1 Tax=Cellulomonas composti TaxID=266130 RepID=A0A511JBF2_9CELL|nr:hypothetical protein [Cellulomonas composti]GEL95129.1 hypothetical protein CCO02nite_17870 [Cellulomonas composti]